jgi:hypothetical protein
MPLGIGRVSIFVFPSMHVYQSVAFWTSRDVIAEATTERKGCVDFAYMLGMGDSDER